MEVEPLAEALDDLVMCCWSCGWWVESYEIDDDGDCEDCGHDKED